jgi:hypothetical protein
MECRMSCETGSRLPRPYRVVGWLRMAENVRFFGLSSDTLARLSFIVEGCFVKVLSTYMDAVPVLRDRGIAGCSRAGRNYSEVEGWETTAKCG